MVAKEKRDVSADRRRFLFRRKHIDRFRRLEAARAHLATDEDVEAVHVASVYNRHSRHERQVLGFGMGAVLGAPGDDDVELAREVRELLVPQERVGELAYDRRGIEELVRREPRNRASGNVSDIVHAGLFLPEADGL